MTAYTFTKVTDNAKFNRGATTTVVATFDVDTETSTTGLANGDTISGVPIPEYATIVGYTLTFDELDTNASPTGTISLGDSGSSTRFLSAVALGGSASSYVYTEANAPAPGAFVASGITQNTPSNGVGYTYTADGTILLTVDAALATAATAGQLTLVVQYTDGAY